MTVDLTADGVTTLQAQVATPTLGGIQYTLTANAVTSLQATVGTPWLVGTVGQADSIETPPATLGTPSRFIPIITADILSQVAGPTPIASATPMRVRKLDKDGDMCFGHGQQDFWRNVPDGPAQCAYTRLVFWKGEWFLDRNDGTDWNQKVLGRHTEATRDPEMILRVSLTQGVHEVLNYSSYLDRNTRQFSVSMNIDTIFGEATIKGPI